MKSSLRRQHFLFLMRLLCSLCCSTERAQFKGEIRNLSDLNEQKLQQYIDESEKRHRMELNEVDERKTNQMMKLIEEHEASMTDMRDYYNDITQNNLTLIGHLKEQMEELRTKLETNERHLNKVISFDIFLEAE